jgi:hypothetical protein
MFGIDPFLLMLAAVSFLTLAAGVLTRWDGLPESRPAVLDCRQITHGMLGEPGLSDRERAWLAELAVLELPRRHIVC